MVVSTGQGPWTSEKSPKDDSRMDDVRLETALGHKPELARNFGLWSLTSLGIVIAK